MPEENIHTQPGSENTEQEQAVGNGERFESDTQKLVRRHLEDKDHVITEEDMASVRVGMVPPQPDEATLARLEDEKKLDEIRKNIVGDEDQIEKSKNDKDNRLTPWDTIDPA